jgi:hypothetical protein
VNAAIPQSGRLNARKRPALLRTENGEKQKSDIVTGVSHSALTMSRTFYKP